MEANLTENKLKYYRFPGYTVYLLPKYQQVARGIRLKYKKAHITMRANQECEHLKQNCGIWRLQRYKNINTAGKEKDDMLNNSDLELIYSDEDSAIYLHHNGTSTTLGLLLASSNFSEHTRNLLLASSDITSSNFSEHTRSKIIDYPGSGHKPVIARISIGNKSVTPKMPTKRPSNFKMADRPRFTNLL
ncbi:unnamed protein product [Rodentolepis nana]|uniref:Ubiquitin-like domain-containing protein n=1 Tax=Rodentolepis nana TaxID=102285 RepID=A0A0R3TGK5_RODNA|nr:unnamed protein product [Rodentolepis nana]